ncbi:hypothetical protein BHE74_00029732, partial [Ensete ventricosum]
CRALDARFCSQRFLISSDLTCPNLYPGVGERHCRAGRNCRRGSRRDSGGRGSATSGRDDWAVIVEENDGDSRWQRAGRPGDGRGVVARARGCYDEGFVGLYG